MKRFLLLLLLSAICSAITSAQFEQGKVEITFNGTAGYLKDNLPVNLYGSQSIGYVMLNTDVGYYLLDGFSIEPQLGLLATENTFPSQSALLNLSYTHRISTSAIALFIRGGYGISNSLSSPVVGFVPIRINTVSNVHLINASGGTKILLSEHVALNIELNYRREAFDDDVPVGLYFINNNIVPLTHTVDYRYSYVGMLFGFSILL
jgi:Outer membrane protein beta-barrel domain